MTDSIWQSPTPAPAPYAQPTTTFGPQTDPSQLWNTAWNQGYNQANSGSNPYAGQVIGGYDIGAGFTQGQQAYVSNMSSGGGGGGGTPTNNYQAPDTSGAQAGMGQEMDEIDNAINAGMSALEQFQSTIQPSADLQVQEAETTAGQQRAETEAEQAARMGELGGQRATAERRTGSAISEARRMASQLQQGNQARYGGSTGTGQFVSEIMGSQATANISNNRAALQETLGKITQVEEQVKTAAQNMITKIDENLSMAKEKALNWVREAMAQVNSQKAQLAGDKARMRMDVIRQYQSVIQNLNETWRQEQNAITQKAQQAGQQLTAWQQSILKENNVSLSEWNFRQPSTTTVGSATNYGTKTAASLTEEEDPLAAPLSWGTNG